MKYLSMQERVDFVNTVVDNTTQDGTYLPALLDIYFRIQVLIDICGIDISQYQPEQYPEVAYGDIYRNNVYRAEIKNDYCDLQIEGLLEACKEEAGLRRDYAIGLANYNKKSSADELLGTITSYLKKAEENIGSVDMKQLSKMLETVSKIDKSGAAGKIAAKKKSTKKVTTFEEVKEVAKNGGKKQPD